MSRVDKTIAYPPFSLRFGGYAQRNEVAERSIHPTNRNSELR